jgi:hypothetical protein
LSGSLENSPDDGTSVPVSHSYAIPIGGSSKYTTFINLCFKTYGGWGAEPKLLTHTNQRIQLAGNAWEHAWDDKYFNAELKDIPDVFKIRDVYADLMSGFSSGLGSGLIVNKVDVPSGLPRQGT